MSLNRELYKFTFPKVLGHFNLYFFFLSSMTIKRILVQFLALLFGLVLFVWTAHHTATHSPTRTRELARYREKQSAALIILYQSACMLLIFHARRQSPVIGVLPYRLSGEYKKRSVLLRRVTQPRALRSVFMMKYIFPIKRQICHFKRLN